MRRENTIQMRIYRVENGYSTLFGGDDFAMVGTTFVENDPDEMLSIAMRELCDRARAIMADLTAKDQPEQEPGE